MPRSSNRSNRRPQTVTYTFRRMFRAFWTEEDGVELLQLLIVVAVTVAVMAAVFSLQASFRSNLREAGIMTGGRLADALSTAQKGAGS